LLVKKRSVAPSKNSAPRRAARGEPLPSLLSYWYTLCIWHLQIYRNLILHNIFLKWSF